VWKDSYLVGVELIDDQHKRLFRAVTDLKDNIDILDNAHYKKQLYETITFLKDYCHTHFSDEQEYLQSIGFKGYEAHKKLHDRLLDSVTEYRNKLLRTNFDRQVVESFLGFLTTWLIYHIGVEDQQIPKKEQISSIKPKYESIYNEYADNIKIVLNILAGLSEQNISCVFDNSRHVDSGVCYLVRLINAKDRSGIGFVFSDSLAYGLVKKMTDIDVAEFIDVMYSALLEISEIIGAKIAGLLSRDTGSSISVELPTLVKISDIKKTASGLLVDTELGAMEVFIL